MAKPIILSFLLLSLYCCSSIECHRKIFIKLPSRVLLNENVPYYSSYSPSNFYNAYDQTSYPNYVDPNTNIGGNSEFNSKYGENPNMQFDQIANYDNANNRWSSNNDQIPNYDNANNRNNGNVNNRNNDNVNNRWYGQKTTHGEQQNTLTPSFDYTWNEPNSRYPTLPRVNPNPNSEFKQNIPPFRDFQFKDVSHQNFEGNSFQAKEDNVNVDGQSSFLSGQQHLNVNQASQTNHDHLNQQETYSPTMDKVGEDNLPYNAISHHVSNQLGQQVLPKPLAYGFFPKTNDHDLTYGSVQVP